MKAVILIKLFPCIFCVWFGEYLNAFLNVDKGRRIESCRLHSTPTIEIILQIVSNFFYVRAFSDRSQTIRQIYAILNNVQYTHIHDYVLYTYTLGLCSVKNRRQLYCICRWCVILIQQNRVCLLNTSSLIYIIYTTSILFRYVHCTYYKILFRFCMYVQRMCIRNGFYC